MERVLTGKPRRAGSRLPEPNADGGDSPAWSRKRGSYEPVGEGRGSSSVPYAELHTHSAYSFLDGASTPEELIEEAARLDLRAIALTDHDGLYGVVRFAEAAKELDVATVFGAELSLGAPRTPTRRGRISWCWPVVPRVTAGCPARSPRHTLLAGRRASRATTSTR
jgi:error-prone DNA polymerase